MSTVSITSKGQITIPLSLRKRLGLQHGSRVELVVVNDHLEMHLPDPPAAASTRAGSGFGLLKSPMSAVPVDFDAATLATPGPRTRKNPPHR
ncbi:AbrB/MazE/SpoVT family DNA-binding domain-containing protein [Sphaerotilus sp.]|uniref:AbrB/MazE/SpoVT family DNA-binding domain-containing protein n=1 Tax=Sphaerotilus sp. TaxID=2093942 RepID=UPI002ACE09E6|nr:AbrB/MazE/SpoVT family DNA-binding domain-containing protein [Sphaerotilus sp.]MDZ7858974.1 AbrB/MazE/SpoVT family DNA-binding domain-containing protein [Sphaerotilus sp.]